MESPTIIDLIESFRNKNNIGTNFLKNEMSEEKIPSEATIYICVKSFQSTIDKTNPYYNEQVISDHIIYVLHKLIKFFELNEDLLACIAWLLDRIVNVTHILYSYDNFILILIVCFGIMQKIIYDVHFKNDLICKVFKIDNKKYNERELNILLAIQYNINPNYEEIMAYKKVLCKN
jgi:hypothetical protein